MCVVLIFKRQTNRCSFLTLTSVLYSTKPATFFFIFASTISILCFLTLTPTSSLISILLFVFQIQAQIIMDRYFKAVDATNFHWPLTSGQNRSVSSNGSSFMSSLRLCGSNWLLRCRLLKPLTHTLRHASGLKLSIYSYYGMVLIPSLLDAVATHFPLSYHLTQNKTFHNLPRLLSCCICTYLLDTST